MRPCGHEGDAERTRCGGSASDLALAEPDAEPDLDGRMPDERLEQRGLAHAVAAHDHEDLLGRTLNEVVDDRLWP
jgi:hypothetical protein